MTKIGDIFTLWLANELLTEKKITKEQFLKIVEKIPTEPELRKEAVHPSYADITK